MSKVRRAKRQLRRNQEKEMQWASSEVGQVKLLRYAKTYAWALRRDKAEIDKLIESGGIMTGYPVGARTVEDAIAMLDENNPGDLRVTCISETDRLALGESLKAHRIELAKELVFKTSPVKQKSWWEKVKYFFYKIFRKTN